MFHSPRITKISLPVLLVISMVLPSVSALAASTPTLGSAGSYAILASTFTNTTAGSTVTGGIGFTTGPAVAPVGVHPQYGPGAPYATAGTDQGSALSALASEPCTFAFPAGAVNLSTETTHGTVGVYTPGVYCSSGAMNIGGPLTLSGNGTFIFRAVGALTSTAGAVVTLSGASACNVFWTPTQATTLGANTTFAGTVIDNAGITVGANTTWIGMALAFGGTVTTDTITISLCTPSVVSSSASSSSLSSSTSVTSSSLSSSSVSSSVLSSSMSSSFTSSAFSSSAFSSSSRSSFSSSRSASSSSIISSSSRSSSSSSRSVIFAPVDETNPPMILPQTGADIGGMMIGLLGVMLATIFVTVQGLARRRS